MKPDAIRKRDAVLKTLWDLEDAGSPSSDPAVAQAARRAVATLEGILAADNAQENPVETGITWKYLGDAYWSLRDVDGRDALDHGRQAYLTGETYLTGPGAGAGAELPLAKLNFNLANTLRLLDGAQNRANLLEARNRYNQAIRGFQRTKPEAVPPVLESLRQVEIALQASDLFERSKSELERGRALQERFKKAGFSPDANLDREVTAEIARMKKSQEKDFAGLAALLRSTGGETSGPSTPSGSASAGSPHSKDFDAAFNMLQRAAKSGEVTPERGETLRRALEQFQNIVEQPAHTPQELAAQSIRMREHLNRARGVASDQSSGLTAVESFLYDQMNRTGVGELERKTLWEYLLECGHIKHALKTAKTEAERSEVKRNRIRPLVHGVRQVALRHHVMVAEPYWGWAPVNAGPGRVFYAGSATLRQALAKSCGERGLELVRTDPGWGAAQSRWNLLRSCGLAVFDLRSEAKDEWPSACHALGIALALSVHSVIVGDPEGGLPFDIDVATPISEEQLGAGLDTALLSLPQTAGSSGLHATIQEVLSRCSQTDATTHLLKQSLAAGNAADALQVGTSLAMLAERNGGGKWALLHPLWPGSYPSVLDRRCFHIMPFAPAFNTVRDRVRRACEAADADYIRADEIFEPNVIRSIWDEICRATHIVVDLSGVNANVCLELALAQTIGRRILIVARPSGKKAQIEGLFPEIAKLQVKFYENEDTLAAMVREFVSRRS
jgi:hypothetical protein